MAANPVVVNTDLVITYDGVKTRLARGTLIDMPVGGTLANATTTLPGGGSSAALSTRVTNLTAQQQIPGSSDSVNVAALENTAGGGVDPYNAGQAG